MNTSSQRTCTLIGLEACAGAHLLGRALREHGHDVKLIPAQFVRPSVKSNKNDFLDAEPIAEAVDRQNMRFVPIKSDRRQLMFRQTPDGCERRSDNTGRVFCGAV
jgi:transposase